MSGEAKIAAIKKVREDRGIGLKEAYAIVDRQIALGLPMDPSETRADSCDLAFDIIANAADVAADGLPTNEACELFERLACHFTRMAEGMLA